MKLEMHGRMAGSPGWINIYPETDQDWAFIHDSMGLERAGDKVELHLCPPDSLGSGFLSTHEQKETHTIGGIGLVE